MPRTRKKTTTPAKTTAPAPVRVRVRVARLFVGSPPLGEVVTLTRSTYLNKLIRAGFLKVLD
jgi:hypothetical protein